MPGLSATTIKQINSQSYTSVLDKSLTLEIEINTFFELIESEFVMVDQLLKGDFPAEFKFLYDKETLKENDCFKSDLELNKKYYVEWKGIECYTSHFSVNCLVEAVFIYNVEEIFPSPRVKIPFLCTQ